MSNLQTRRYNQNHRYYKQLIKISPDAEKRICYFPYDFRKQKFERFQFEASMTNDRMSDQEFHKMMRKMEEELAKAEIKVNKCIAVILLILAILWVGLPILICMSCARQKRIARAIANINKMLEDNNPLIKEIGLRWELAPKAAGVLLWKDYMLDDFLQRKPDQGQYYEMYNGQGQYELYSQYGSNMNQNQDYYIPNYNPGDIQKA